jgi:hypothetical protein
VNKIDRENYLLLKNKAESLLEDLEVITISLSVTKDRFKCLFNEDDDQKKEDVIRLLESIIKDLLINQKEIRAILNQSLYDRFKDKK